MRLQGSRNQYEGRVEVCKLERWQTVCDMGFDTMEASVICRQLGFSRMSKKQSIDTGISLRTMIGRYDSSLEIHEHFIILNVPADAAVTSLFGPGFGNVYGTNVQCTGNEQRFTDCTFSQDVSSCTHANDAGITCNVNCKHTNAANE